MQVRQHILLLRIRSVEILLDADLQFGSPSIMIIPRSLLTQRVAIASSPAESSLPSNIPPSMMPLMHSYRSDIAPVVWMIEVRGGKSFFTRRGSRGVKVAN
jgi:hypothetical protein